MKSGTAEDCYFSLKSRLTCKDDLPAPLVSAVLQSALIAHSRQAQLWGKDEREAPSLGTWIGMGSHRDHSAPKCRSKSADQVQTAVREEMTSLTSLNKTHVTVKVTAGLLGRKEGIGKLMGQERGETEDRREAGGILFQRQRPRMLPLCECTGHSLARGRTRIASPKSRFILLCV